MAIGRVVAEILPFQSETIAKVGVYQYPGGVGIKGLRQDPPPPPLFEFLVILTFLHHGIGEVERHLLSKFHKNIQRKSWSNVPPKLLACIRFLYKVVH